MNDVIPEDGSSMLIQNIVIHLNSEYHSVKF
jgi:hypothetical protein